MTIEKSDPYTQYAERFNEENYAIKYDNQFKASSKSSTFGLKEALGSLVAKAEIKAVKRNLSGCKVDVIADIPCGSGKIIKELDSDSSRIVGVDRSKPMITQCRAYTGNSELLRADVRFLPLKDSSVGVVVCNRFLHRIPPVLHGHTLREIRRISERHAILYFAVKTPLTDVIMMLERNLGIGDRGEIFFQTRKEIRDELTINGWHIIKQRSVIPWISTGFTVLAEKVPLP